MKITNVFFLLLLAVAFSFGDLIPSRHDSLAWAKPIMPAEKHRPQAQEELPKIIFLNQSAVLIASKKTRESTEHTRRAKRGHGTGHWQGYNSYQFR